MNENINIFTNDFRNALRNTFENDLGTGMLKALNEMDDEKLGRLIANINADLKQHGITDIVITKENIKDYFNQVVIPSVQAGQSAGNPILAFLRMTAEGGRRLRFFRAGLTQEYEKHPYLTSLRLAFKENPYYSAALATLGPTALLGGAYGAYRGAKEKSFLRSILFGALSGAGGGALYRLFNVPAVDSGFMYWLPMAVGALIGAGGGVGAYGLGRLLG